jgi:uncharacterized protein (TIGR02145 family)
MINQRIKDYTILRKIGEGGMANVYLAEHILLGTKVALKVLNQDFVRNQNIRNRFLAEARNIAKMQHKHIIRVSDLIDAGDFVAFAMDYIEGPTLKDYLEEKGGLGNTEIKTLLLQMLDALSYVHHNHLVHRDVKPSNFILGKDGVLKLLDFGIAKNMDAASADYTSTGTTQQMGTIMYMSPEQVKSTKDVTQATDIYSLGVVLWQMVKGSAPYNPSTSGNFEIQSKIVHEPLPITQTKWDLFIQKATSKIESDRFIDCNQWKASAKLLKVNMRSSNRSENIRLNKDSNQEKKYLRNPKIEEENTGGGQLLTIFLVLLSLIIFFIAYNTLNESEKEYDGEEDLEYSGEAIIYLDQEIGDQIWMTENLNVSQFRNGDIIPEAKTSEEWENAGNNEEPAWCYYDNDPANAEKYGKLYNWFAVNDSRGLAPEGWHIPTHNEFYELESALQPKPGKKLKSITDWSFDQNGTNESGFNGYPGGCREFDNTSEFKSMFKAGVWWTSTMDNQNYAWGHFLQYKDDNLDRDRFNIKSGFSVRCIKN